LGFLQIIFQAIAAYFSFVIYRFNRLNKAWLFVTFALILMTFRRITASLIEFSLISNFSGTIALLDRIILPFLISIFLFLGLWAMLKNFESFEVVATKTKIAVSKLKK
jgi:hypothetical protein